MIPRPLSYFGLLGFVFLVLKLTGQITWSWWYVFLPWYGVAAAAVGFVVLAWAVLFTLGLMSSVAKEVSRWPS